MCSRREGHKEKVEGKRTGGMIGGCEMRSGMEVDYGGGGRGGYGREVVRWRPRICTRGQSTNWLAKIGARGRGRGGGVREREKGERERENVPPFSINLLLLLKSQLVEPTVL